MLGSTARKLRILGFDTLYFREGSDLELERAARVAGRTILTSDAGLFALAKRRGVRVVLVVGKTDRARLLSILGRPGMRLRQDWRSRSRCAVCNGRLLSLPREDAKVAGVPPSSLARHRLFYRCASCSRCYWRGRHWVRLGRLARSLSRPQAA